MEKEREREVREVAECECELGAVFARVHTERKGLSTIFAKMFHVILENQNAVFRL